MYRCSCGRSCPGVAQKRSRSSVGVLILQPGAEPGSWIGQAWARRNSSDSVWEWPKLFCDHPHKACPAQGGFDSLVPRINHGFLLNLGVEHKLLSLLADDKRKCRIVRSLSRLRTDLNPFRSLALASHWPLSGRGGRAWGPYGCSDIEGRESLALWLEIDGHAQ